METLMDSQRSMGQDVVSRTVSLSKRRIFILESERVVESLVAETILET